MSEQAFDCAQLNASSFVWLSWNDYLGQVKTAVDNDKNYLEGNVYLGRNILQREENPFEFCRLEMSTGHCVAIGGSQDVLSTEVLVQRLPLRYDLKTVQRGSWKNVTEGETIVLAKTHLINRDENTQFVQKVIPFDLAREVQFELPDHLVQDIAVNVYDEAGRLGLRFDVGDAATTLISKSVPAIKRLLGRTILEVTVKGRTERVLSMLTGDLITVFDRNDDKAVAERFTKNLVLNVSIFRSVGLLPQHEFLLQIVISHYRVSTHQSPPPTNLLIEDVVLCVSQTLISSGSMSASKMSKWSTVYLRS